MIPLKLLWSFVLLLKADCFAFGPRQPLQLYDKQWLLFKRTSRRPYSEPRRHPSARTFHRETSSVQFTKPDNEEPVLSTPPPGMLQSNSRIALGTLSLLGFLETLFITNLKLSSQPAAISRVCSVLGSGRGGCTDVLTGPYSSLFGIPLSLFGVVAYAAVAFLALTPLVKKNATPASAKMNHFLLLLTSTVMSTFSIGLMGLLAFVIKAPCPFCFVSAGLSIAIGGIVWVGGGVDTEGVKRFQAGVLGIILTAGLSIAIFMGGENAIIENAVATNNPQALVGPSKRAEIENALTNVKPPKITAKSSDEAMRIARELEKLNTRFFGAFWCTHCFDQKQTLGKEAMELIPYFECDQDGFNSQRKLCKDLKLPGYPTWEINGELYPGEQSLKELDDIIKLANLEKEEEGRK